MMKASFFTTIAAVFSLGCGGPGFASLQEQPPSEQGTVSNKVLEQIQIHLTGFGVSVSAAQRWQDHLLSVAQEKNLATQDPMFLALGLWQADQETKRQQQAGQVPLAPERMLTCTLGSALSLSHHPWSQVGDMVRLIQTNPYLTHLDLFQCGVTDQHIPALMSLLHLRHLRLEENGITDQGALNLAAHPTLITLILWKNKIGAPGAKALAQNRVLKELGLYKNSVGDLGAQALALSTTLTHLDLRENNIGNVGAQALALNPTLLSLRLRYNNITDEGAKAFLNNRHLTHLELARNPISKDLIEILENLAPSNGYLHLLQDLGPALPLSSKKKVRILSIDGGGIRGLIPALILDYLEQEMSRSIGAPFHFAEHVELMAGTSTGGLICLALNIPGEHGVPQYLPRTLVELYENKGSEIFPKPWCLLKKVVEAQYSPSNLESILAYYFGRTPLSACVSHTLITAFDLDSSQAHIFDSREAKVNRSRDFEITGTARATSAAPTYFPAAQITNQEGKSYTFVDGGIYANNPTLLALRNAKLMYPEAEEYLVISLGTGAAPSQGKYSDLSNGGLIQWGVNIASVLMNTAAEYTQNLIQEECQQDKRIRYVRLQAVLEPSEIEMDNVTEVNIERLKASAQQTIKSQYSALEDLLEEFKHDYGS